MGKTLGDLRPVFVVGVGLHRYQEPSQTTYVQMGLTAIREALRDAGIGWTSIESAYVGTALLGIAPGRAMLRYLGATGISIAQVENASASGSTAFRQACMEVASTMSDVVLAIGVDKLGPANLAPPKAGIKTLAGPAVGLLEQFALIAEEYRHRYRVSPEQIAMVALKNHNNAARNPYAHFQQEKTLDEILGSGKVAGTLTRYQCCPSGDGAAAVIVASEEGIERLGIDASRAVRVKASVLRSERVYEGGKLPLVELTRETTQQAYEQTGIGPQDLDTIELHDAFSIEELLYYEAMGLCEEGQGAQLLESGATQIGGRCAVNPSGGLLAMGHPFGPTGAGQIVELTRQLRGEAGTRQQPDARLGLAHMLGIGQVCVVHILEAGTRAQV